MNKIIIPAILLSMSCSVAASTVEQRLIKCSQIETTSLRLSCFDTLTSTINVKQLNQSEKRAQQEIAQVKTKEIFGFENKQLAKTPDKIIAKVVALRKNPRGLHIVSMDNQQVWQQKSASNFRLKLGDEIYIKKGALGSFFLGKEGQNKKIKVKRIK